MTTALRGQLGHLRVRNRVKTRNVPTLAVLAAVCFLIMMFNVPIPDGTTAHAVGGALVAILLGSWASVIAVSVALAFQALLFGDGGVLAYGANVFNMAIVLPSVSYGLYRLISGKATLTSPRRAVAGFIGGYVGLNTAALCAGIELGIQPTLFHDANGAPLYSPYHLSQAVPAMLLAHLLVAGIAEGIIKLGLSAVPAGRNKYNGIWHKAIFSGYDFAGDSHPTLGYLISAVVGIW